MTQDLLNHLVQDAKAMKIRRQATPERMPAMPFGTRLFNRGLMHIVVSIRRSEG